MRSSKVVLATYALVGIALFAVPLPLMLMAVNLGFGLLAAAAFGAGAWGLMRLIDGKVAWGRPPCGAEIDSQLALWRSVPPSL